MGIYEEVMSMHLNGTIKKSRPISSPEDGCPYDYEGLQTHISSVDRKIIVFHDPKPIPTSQFDYCAHYKDEGEESGNYGWGSTEEAAINDLRNK